MRYIAHLWFGKNKDPENIVKTVDHTVVGVFMMLAKFGWLVFFLMLLLNIFIEIFGCNLLG